MPIRSQRGSTVVVFGIWFGVLMLLLGIVLDAGRLYMTREQMRAALDAATLAGALQFRREVTVKVPVNQIVNLVAFGLGIRVIPSWRPVTGDRETIWEQQGYLRAAECMQSGFVRPPWSLVTIDCHDPPCILSETPVVSPRIEAEARATLALNAPWLKSTDVSFAPQADSGTVVAHGYATVPLHFMRLIGLSSFRVKVSPEPKAQLVPPDKSAPEYCSGARIWG